MSESAFVTLGDPAVCGLPLLAHIPHSGTAIPSDVRADITLDDDALALEVRRVSDLHVDSLYLPAMPPSCVAIVNRLSRLVIDPERFRDDASEPLSQHGAGAVYTRTTSGEVLRDISSRARRALLERFYDPYAEHIASVCEQMLDRFGAVLIVDCHSFPTQPVAWAADQDAVRPEICIGTDDHHTPNALAQSLLGLCESEGYVAFRDKPYRGAYVPLAYYGKDPRVRSVLIEVRRDLYMDEASGATSSRFATTQALLAKMLDMCATEARFIARETVSPVEVSHYDPLWTEQYAKIEGVLHEALGPMALRIDHIGSTAVPGLDAKPVIDVQIIVASLDQVDSYRPAIEQAGYRFMPHHSDVTRHYFREADGPRTHIHVYPQGAQPALDNLSFRDHLRNNAEARERYSAIKRQVVARFGGNRAVYTDAKQPVVLAIMRDAREQEGSA